MAEIPWVRERKSKIGGEHEPRVNSKAANVLAAAGILRRREGDRPRNRPALIEKWVK